MFLCFAGVPLFSGGFLSSSGVRVPAVCWSCVRMTNCPLSYTSAYIRAYIHAYTRARGFLDYKFLDITIIFRPLRNF